MIVILFDLRLHLRLKSHEGVSGYFRRFLRTLNTGYFFLRTLALMASNLTLGLTYLRLAACMSFDSCLLNG